MCRHGFVAHGKARAQGCAEGCGLLQALGQVYGGGAEDEGEGGVDLWGDFDDGELREEGWEEGGGEADEGVDEEGFDELAGGGIVQLLTDPHGAGEHLHHDFAGGAGEEEAYGLPRP
jgi:hypothetical protein